MKNQTIFLEKCSMLINNYILIHWINKMEIRFSYFIIFLFSSLLMTKEINTNGFLLLTKQKQTKKRLFNLPVLVNRNDHK